MLAAAAVQLEWQLRGGNRGRRAIAHAANTRRVLVRRPELTLRIAAAVARETARPAIVTGRIAQVEFLKRPRKPVSRVTLTSSGATIQVPFKNVLRLGWRAGVSIAVRANIARHDGRAIAEAMFEGPGSHQRTVWEDWLAVLARPIYDLYPETLDAEWSLVDADGGMLLGDLASRMS
jgi:hypothetical protein